MKTWHVEGAVVAAILALSTYLLTPCRTEDWLAAAAGQMDFHYMIVATRLDEDRPLPKDGEEASLLWLTRYLLLKEGLWASAFLCAGLYPPLIAVGVFLLYAPWRKFWVKVHPKKVL